MNYPQILILIRLLLAPIIIFLALKYGVHASNGILILMYLGLLTDIFDGIIARKLNCSTEKLRRLDSQVDLIFWISIGISAWLIYPELLAAKKYWIALIFITEGLCYAVSFIKFGKETCTHAFLSKLWGISILIAFTYIFGFGIMGIPFLIALIMAFISHLDVLLILLILPKWQHDIPSAYHAYLIRKGIQIKKNKFLNS